MVSVRRGKYGGRETYWGYDVEALIAVPRIGEKGPRRDEPSMVVRLVAIRASTDIVGPCLRMIDSMMAEGIRLGELLVDRHYSYKAYDRWGSELLRRGIHQAAATLRRAVRQPPDTDGRCKVRCPARNGTLGCPLVSGTIAAAAVHNLPIVTEPPPEADRPRICAQDTVTLRAATTAQQKVMKLHQPDYWGSPAWEKNYARRTRIEGWFGVLKSASSTGMDRDSYQFRGLPWVTLVLTLAAAVTNLHLLRSWHASSGLGDPDHPLLQPDQPFHGFTQLTAEQAREIDRQCAKQYAASPTADAGAQRGRLAS